MVTTLGISLYSYVYLKLAKMLGFFILSLTFSLQQSQIKMVEQGWCGGKEAEGGPNNIYTCK
jgi:hypothetical protein